MSRFKSGRGHQTFRAGNAGFAGECKMRVVQLSLLVALFGAGVAQAADTPKPSFECARAKSAAEKAVCATPDLAKLDRDMAASYEKLRANETPESFATVRASQAGRLAFTQKMCAGGGQTVDEEKPDPATCLSDNYETRGRALAQLKLASAGPLRLEPRMTYSSNAKPMREEEDTYPWMTGGAEAAPFNAYIAKALKVGKPRIDLKDIGDISTIPPQLLLSAQRSYSVLRFAGGMASLMISTYDYLGGAHEAIGETTLNWDVAKAKPIMLGDVFRAGTAWRKAAADYCWKDLKAQMAAQDSSEPARDAVDAVVGKSDAWLFGTKSATVHFTVYTVTSFAGGEFDVEIPYAVLKPYLRPDNPVKR